MKACYFLANEAHSGQPSPLEICNPDIAVKSPCFRTSDDYSISTSSVHRFRIIIFISMFNSSFINPFFSSKFLRHYSNNSDIKHSLLSTILPYISIRCTILTICTSINCLPFVISPIFNRIYTVPYFN